MNLKFLSIIEGKQNIYPSELEEKYPRIFTKLVDLWQTPDIDSFLQDLMMDKRSGNRDGFPETVAAEIMRLSSYLQELRGPSDDSDAWGEVPDYKRSEISKFGYELTPRGLLKSVEDNNSAAMRMFLSCGINLEARDDRNWTPLMISAFNGNEEFALLLIKSGAKMIARDNNGYTPIHWAAYNGADKVVKLLLEKDVDPNLLSYFGWTALMQAATRGHLLPCAYLIARGADVNLATKDGWTALHKAANNGHTQIVKLLLSKGANRFAQYQDGNTPIDLALKSGHLDLVTLMNQYAEAPLNIESEILSIDMDR
jgi:ankyrin repeat protein